MAAFRFLAWFLVALAVALLGADGVSSLEKGEPVMRSTADILALVGFDTEEFRKGAEGGVANAAKTLLGLPFWGVIGVIGVVLTLIFRPIR